MSMTAKALIFANLLALLTLGSCKSGPSKENAPAAKVNPTAVQDLAKAPAPPADAATTEDPSIGSGLVVIDTDNGSDDVDATWIQELDIDGDGSVETTTLLWDDEDKVLFAYAETEVACAYGGVAVAAVLVGVNARGNSRGRPAGSGFYVVYLDKTQCGSEGAGLYGAKFDLDGHVTEAGAVVIDPDMDTVWVVDPGYWVY